LNARGHGAPFMPPRTKTGLTNIAEHATPLQYFQVVNYRVYPGPDPLNIS